LVSEARRLPIRRPMKKDDSESDDSASDDDDQRLTRKQVTRDYSSPAMVHRSLGLSRSSPILVGDGSRQEPVHSSPKSLSRKLGLPSSSSDIPDLVSSHQPSSRRDAPAPAQARISGGRASASDHPLLLLDDAMNTPPLSPEGDGVRGDVSAASTPSIPSPARRMSVPPLSLDGDGNGSEGGSLKPRDSKGEGLSSSPQSIRRRLDCPGSPYAKLLEKKKTILSHIRTSLCAAERIKFEQFPRLLSEYSTVVDLLEKSTTVARDMEDRDVVR